MPTNDIEKLKQKLAEKDAEIERLNKELQAIQRDSSIQYHYSRYPLNTAPFHNTEG